jgi:mannosyl-3-phosphoglycerate phosphatase
LQEKQIPLVFCTSKTAAEMIPFRKEIKNKDPFIVENGGGIYIPKSYFANLPVKTRKSGHFLVISRGLPYIQLQEILARISRECGLTVHSFDQLKASKLAESSGLSLEQAQHALQREFDLPFSIVSPHPNRSQLEEKVQQLGLKLIQGGRFFHLSSNREKGEAVAQLIGLYQANRGGPVRSMGLGDSRNDLSMLEEVDIPVIIPNPHSIAPLADEFPGGHRAHTPGPKGWNDAVLSLLETEPIEKGKLTG